MSFKKYVNGVWQDVEGVKRFADGQWQDAEFVRRWDGANWVPVWESLWFQRGSAESLGSLGHVTSLDGGAVELFLKVKDSEQIPTYSAEICLNKALTFSASSTLELDWERASPATNTRGSASLFGLDSNDAVVWTGTKDEKDFDRTTTQYSLSAGTYRLFITVQLEGAENAQTALTIYGIKIDGKTIPIKLD